MTNNNAIYESANEATWSNDTTGAVAGIPSRYDDDRYWISNIYIVLLLLLLLILPCPPITITNTLKLILKIGNPNEKKPSEVSSSCKINMKICIVISDKKIMCFYTIDEESQVTPKSECQQSNGYM